MSEPIDPPEPREPTDGEKAVRLLQRRVDEGDTWQDAVTWAFGKLYLSLGPEEP